MKKILSLLVMMMCCFGFIGYVDAATTYEEKVNSNQPFTFTFYKEKTEKETKKVSEISGEIKYGVGYGFYDATGKYSLVEPKTVTFSTASTVDDKKALIGKITIFDTQSGLSDGFVYDYVYKIESYDGENDLYNVVKYTAEKGTYYASSTYQFDKSTGKYTLTGTPVSTAYADLKDKYICESGNDTICKKMYKVISIDGEKGIVDIYDVKTKTVTSTTTSTSQTQTTTNTSDTSNKNGSVQTTKNPNTGLSDYVMYIIPFALVVGSVIAIKRKHA